MFAFSKFFGNKASSKRIIILRKLQSGSKLTLEKKEESIPMKRKRGGAKISGVQTMSGILLNIS